MSQLNTAKVNLKSRAFPAGRSNPASHVVTVDTALQVVSLVVEHYEGEIERLNEVIKQYRIKEMQREQG